MQYDMKKESKKGSYFHKLQSRFGEKETALSPRFFVDDLVDFDK